MPPPPPFGSFPKKHPVWEIRSPLRFLIFKQKGHHLTGTITDGNSSTWSWELLLTLESMWQTHESFPTAFKLNLPRISSLQEFPRVSASSKFQEFLPSRFFLGVQLSVGGLLVAHLIFVTCTTCSASVKIFSLVSKNPV